jgi:hypothetical protein
MYGPASCAVTVEQAELGTVYECDVVRLAFFNQAPCHVLLLIIWHIILQ